MFNKVYNYKRWELWELEYIEENYKVITYSVMAKHLGRNEKQIRNKVYYERLKNKK